MKKHLTLACFLLLLFLPSACNSHEKEVKLVEYVDPFIGTGGHGHCFPGATVPFGGIQLSPDNPRSDWDWCSGYHWSDSIISSFSHTHLSGTGIGDLQDIRFLPVLTRPDSAIPAARYIQENYARFSHQNEEAEPGYYRVQFDNGIVTELSVTERCGFHYYQFPANPVQGLVLDLTTARNWDRTAEASLKKVNNRTLQGHRKSRGWARDQRVYFVIEFSQDVEVLAGKNRLRPLQNGQKITADSCYAWIDFGSNTNKILAKISLSSANCEGAEANLNKELPHWSFDKVKRDARQAWRKELLKTRAESRDEELLKVFYTALYHAYTAPYLFSDIHGNFKGPDGEIHSNKKNAQYTVFSLWDTFRATHPLFTITQKRRVGEMIRSLLKHYEATGLLPVWELAGNETNCMIGNHAISVIVEAYLKGIRDFNAEQAYEAVKTTALAGKAGIPLLRRYGYIPYDQENESVSKTLEYAYDDWCVAQFAKALDKEEDYLFFMKESKNYANLFDPSTGFMRGKSSGGEWKTPFSPVYSKHRDDEYTEGNAWQYSWFVPHDVSGLIALHGGEEAFVRKLDSLFTISSVLEGEEASPDISGMIGQYAQGNEPSHHVAYLYNYAGAPHKAQFYLNRIMRELYKTGPEGLCGNEDCGQMSAWFVFSAMGFYPVNPAEGKYQLGTPLFDRVTIRTGPERKFTVTANKETPGHIYVTKALLNGKELDRSWITHEEIMQGGSLEFVLTDQQP
ncbi:MAG: GH92 family glycosyl hydrolase [Culturomica sp.]|jgi:predicted alpha-1,2-mannosidase|nr:GH92 family glycosyl hydrolase [Culturomica sp.]